MQPVFVAVVADHPGDRLAHQVDQLQPGTANASRPLGGAFMRGALGIGGGRLTLHLSVSCPLEKRAIIGPHRIVVIPEPHQRFRLLLLGKEHLRMGFQIAVQGRRPCLHRTDDEEVWTR